MYLPRASQSEANHFPIVSEADQCINKNLTTQEELACVKEELMKVRIELRRKNVELRNLHEDLERFREQWEQLAFASNHGLQEPLRKTIIFSNLLMLRAVRLDKRARIYAEKIKVSALRITALVKDLSIYI